MRLAFVLFAIACGSHPGPPGVDAPPVNGGEAITPVTTCNLTIPSVASCPPGLTCMVDQPYATIGGTTLMFDLALNWRQTIAGLL